MTGSLFLSQLRKGTSVIATGNISREYPFWVWFGWKRLLRLRELRSILPAVRLKASAKIFSSNRTWKGKVFKSRRTIGMIHNLNNSEETLPLSLKDDRSTHALRKYGLWSMVGAWFPFPVRWKKYSQLNESMVSIALGEQTVNHVPGAVAALQSTSWAVWN